MMNATIPSSVTTLTHAPSLKRAGVNPSRRERAEQAFREVIDTALKRGFYGVCAVEVQIADGTIQQIHRKVEQFERD